jgi:hypothetical protein
MTMMAGRKAKAVQDAQPNVTLVAALPGEDDADALLVDATVTEINEVWRKGGLETARQIGELVTMRFFDGDIANAHSRKGRHKSYQALVSHKGLKMAASNLWYCVAVYEHFGVLPVEVAEALTVGHHRQLSHVKDVEQRVALAHLAVAEKLTVEDLKKAITTAKPAGPDAKPRGRPRLNPVVRQLNLASKALQGLKAWDASQMNLLRPEDKAAALAAAKSFADEVVAWLAGIEAEGAR